MLCASAGDLRAFERTQTCDPSGRFACEPDESPKPIAWPVRCVEYRINERGSDQFASGDDAKIGDRLRNLVGDSFEAWNAPSCSDLQLVEGELTDEDRARVVRSGGVAANTNIVVWRDDDWPRRNNRYAFALTSVSYDSSTGEIKDADIEINSETYDFKDFGDSNAADTGNIDT